MKQLKEILGEFMKQYKRRINLKDITILVSISPNRYSFWYRGSNERTYIHVFDIDIKDNWLAELITCTFGNIQYKNIVDTNKVKAMIEFITTSSLVKRQDKSIELFIQRLNGAMDLYDKF